MKTLLRASRDPIRLVRIEAAFGLRAVDVQSLFREWLSAQDVLAELPETNYNRGLFFTARGAVAEAERAYRTAIRLWPHDLAPRQNLALLLAGAGQPRDAEVEWKELLEEQPGWPPALFSLGLLHAEEGRWADAIAELENCLRGNPGYPRGWYNLGVTYAAQGRISEARAAFQRAAADPSSKVDALRELASLNLLQEDQ
ncbi:MAG: tetratricopeptide repeat protein, partial [Deltaproteobacteria bacterium]